MSISWIFLNGEDKMSYGKQMHWYGFDNETPLFNFQGERTSMFGNVTTLFLFEIMLDD